MGSDIRLKYSDFRNIFYPDTDHRTIDLVKERIQITKPLICITLVYGSKFSGTHSSQSRGGTLLPLHRADSFPFNLELYINIII